MTPPAIKRVGVFGMGKAGSALTRTLLKGGLSVEAANRSALSIRTFGHLKSAPLPSLKALLARLQEQSADVLFLAVSDDAIADLTEEIASYPWLPPCVAHLSGAQGAVALGALSQRTATASFHPLAALRTTHAIEVGTLIAIDASTPAWVQQLQTLATSLDLLPAQVPHEQRARYHLGASITANLAMALLDIGVTLFEEAGVDKEVARQGLALLLKGAAEGAMERPLLEALTGPIARGDAQTIKRHLKVLQARSDDDTKTIYQLLSGRLCQVANLTHQQASAIKAQLKTGEASLPKDHSF